MPNCTVCFRNIQAMVHLEDFEKLDIRCGIIREARLFPEARKPAYQLVIDFGPETGWRKSSAQLTGRYKVEDLPGKAVLAVVNFPPRQIGPFHSEVLVLGLPDANGDTVLVVPENEVPPGAKLH